MVKFTVEQKLQALNLLKEGYSSCSVAQIIGAESHQAIATWAAQYQIKDKLLKRLNQFTN